MAWASPKENIMGNDIKTAIRPAISFLILFTLITGLAYPLAITGIAQLIFPYQANGSIIRDGDRVIGSTLIGQNFAAPGYFHPRPSAASDGYNAAASSGSNLGPTSQVLADSVKERVATARAEGVTGSVPADMVTSSGSGLDPDISPANAIAQVSRIAVATGIPEADLRALVERSVERPTLGVLGAPHVNVLLLNRQVDAMAAQARP
jgi:K+-transporting ATPase ATPase C chain